MPHRCCHLPNNLKARGGYSLYFTMGKEMPPPKKNRAVVGGPTGPAMAWPLFLPRIFKTILCLLKSSVLVATPPPLRQHFGTTWPDHFSKADYDPAKLPIFLGDPGPQLLRGSFDPQTCHVAYHGTAVTKLTIAYSYIFARRYPPCVRCGLI